MIFARLAATLRRFKPLHIPPCVVAGASIVVCGACQTPSNTHNSAASRAAAATTPSAATTTAAVHNGLASAAPLPSTLIPPATDGAGKAGCRLVRVTGAGEWFTSGQPLTALEVLNGQWFHLAAHAEVFVKHMESGREWLLHGPAQAQFCRAGAEQVTLTEGRLVVAPGVGLRPGADVLVATPFAAFSYSDAQFELDVGANRARLSVQSGTLQKFDPEPQKLSTGKPVFLHKPLGSAEQLLETCRTAAEHAATLAEAVLAGTGPLGERASAHVVGRQNARRACALAESRAASVTLAAERQRLMAEIDKANVRWQAVPQLRPAH